MKYCMMRLDMIKHHPKGGFGEIKNNWMPVLETALGISEDHWMADLLCEYCHSHRLNEEAMLAGGGDMLSVGGSPVVSQKPTIAETALPQAIRLIWSVEDLLKDKQVMVAPGPNMILVGDDNHNYHVRTHTFEFQYDMPLAVALDNPNTNIAEIHEDRMLRKVTEEFRKMIEADDYDTLILYNLGQMVWVNERDKLVCKYRVRLAKLDSENMTGGSPKPTPGIPYPGEVEADNPGMFRIELEEEPSAFKQWLAELLFGKRFTRG